MFNFGTKSLASEQTLCKHWMSASNVCAINMLTEKMAGIYDEKLLFATWLRSHRKRNAYYMIWVKFTILQDKKLIINLKDKEKAWIEKHYPKSNW